MKKTIINNPNASVLINSMRAIGYDFKSAVADIIDNSITAKANEVNVNFTISNDEKITLRILDDGLGMDGNTLQEAMRFGTIKINGRSNDDLGRFGLGLKTASISQARKFSVISKKDGVISALCWDLDEIKDESWKMIVLNEEDLSSFEEYHKVKNSNSFTLVIWEKIDSLDSEVNIYNDELAVFHKFIEDTKEHVALTFHRYIENGLKIKFNNDKLTAKDPFLKNHQKTKINPEQSISTKTKQKQDVEIQFQVFILPYHKDLKPTDYDMIGGRDLSKDQGFYIYRNKRLMAKGDWYNIRGRSPLYENARIRIDIPSSLDDLWSIDVKKQKAVIPASVKNQLIKEVTKATNTGRELLEYQGKITVQKESIWNKLLNERENKVSYSVNLESNSLSHLVSKLDDESKNILKQLLSLVELTLPYQEIYNSVSKKNDINSIDEEKKNSLINQAVALVDFFRNQENKPREAIIKSVCKIEPFKSANIEEILLNMKGKS
jgi:hypothetical protein